MSFTTLSSWGPGITPSTIKRLIIWTCVLALISATLQSLFDKFNFFPGPEYIFSLSWWGISKLFLWQPVSYLFIVESPYGLSFSFFISLFFSMYILWVIGTPLLDVVGKGPFLRLYLVGGVVSGLLTIMITTLFGQTAHLAGATPSIIAILTVWSMAFPEAEILLFFLVPVKAKWLTASIIGLMFLVALSEWDLIHLVLYMSAVIVGYAYAATAWGWRSPFTQTRPLDARLASWGLYLRRHTPKRPQWLKFKSKSATPEKANSGKANKVIDITTKQPLSNDDAFVDAMLTKIAKSGEQSLNWNERNRLQQISEKKLKK